MRRVELVVAALFAAAPAPVAAQPSERPEPARAGELAAAAVPAPDEAVAATPAAGGDEGEESPELRALRLAEMELFARDEPLLDLGRVDLRTLGVIPGALSSDAPAASGAPSAHGGGDLSWLVGLTLPDIPVRWDDRVVRYLEHFRSGSGHALIASWMARRERWGAMIRRVLREEGVPEDLLYVAMIESGFRADARSDAGAVGPWQFVAATGAEYGLTQSHWIDLRRDPEASTRAAARYLRALHERFGSWELALAAYNMGYGALLRAIRKYDTNDYWELAHLENALPFETTLYVAKAVACAIVGHNLDRFGLDGLAMEPATDSDVVEIPGGTTLAALARAAGTTTAVLRELNPALRRDRVPPGATYALRIPAGTSERFAVRWERARPRHPAHVAYAVRFGETLDDVARRYRTSVRALREINELAEDDAVTAGLELMVPAVEPRADVVDAPPVVGVVAASFELPGRRRVFYRCHRGDDVREIARFFRVTLDELATWNALDVHAELWDGMFLQLFVPASVDLARAVVLTPDDVRILVVGSDEFFEHHLAEEGRVRLRYRVREGDTLSGIGARFGISVGSLCRINLVGRDAVLRVGQEIVVYAEPGRVPEELRAEALGETASASDVPSGAAASSALPSAEASGSASAADPATHSAYGSGPDGADTCAACTADGPGALGAGEASAGAVGAGEASAHAAREGGPSEPDAAGAPTAPVAGGGLAGTDARAPRRDEVGAPPAPPS